jgi:hypothetical protein
MVNKHTEILSCYKLDHDWAKIQCFRDRGNLKNGLELNYDTADHKVRFQLFYTAHWLTFFRAKDAVWPPLTSLTTIRFLWMLFTAIGMKCPSVSGPSKRVSFRRITPFKVVPDTTVPTPCVKQEIAQFSYMAIPSTDITSWCKGHHPMFKTAILWKPCLPTRGEGKKREPRSSSGSKGEKGWNSNP